MRSKLILKAAFLKVSETKFVHMEWVLTFLLEVTRSYFLHLKIISILWYCILHTALKIIVIVYKICDKT